MTNLTLPSGIVIDTSDGSVIDDPNGTMPSVASVDEVSEDINIDPSDLIADRRKMVSELPGDPKLVNICSVVYVYTTLGLSDMDTAEIIGTSVEHIRDLRNTEAYKELVSELLTCYERAVQNNIKGKFIHASGRAAKKVIDTIASKSEDNALNASKHVLGMAGLTPATVVEHRHSIEDELVIRVVRDDKKPEIELDLVDGISS